MTPVRPLRSILTLQTIMVLMVPFVVSTIGVAALLYPSIRNDIYLHQQQIAITIVSQIGSYLEDAKSTVRGIAYVKTGGKPNWQQIQQVVDAQMSATESLEVIYALDSTGKVRAVGLKPGQEGQRDDIMGLDISRNPVVSRLSARNPMIWSDSFLSVVGGGLSVAFAASAPDKVVVGEIHIKRLTSFLDHVSELGEEQIFILDRHGNLLADDQGRYTGKQLNLSNLPLVRHGMDSKSIHTGTITIGSQDMVACYAPIPAIGWGVLVGLPQEVAYQSLRTSMGGIAIGAIIAIMLGIMLSRKMARKLAGRFEQLAAHARQIANDRVDVQWPESSIAEIRELTADLRQMADKIGEREQRLSTLMQNIPGMVYRCTSDREWTITFASDGCTTLTGYMPAELLHNSRISYKNLVHADDRERIGNEILDSLARKEPFTLQYRILTASGEVKTVQEHGQGIFDPEGNVVALEGVITDISTQVRLEEQLRHSQKMESIGQLAGGVAHDFNNMLTAILGSAEIITAALPEGDRLRNFATTITNAATKSADLVRKLLLFSRKAPHNMLQIDLHQLLHETLGIFERSIDKRIGIETDFSATPASIVGDSAQLDNAFLNILLNARDAMPDGGTIRIVTRCFKVDDSFARQIGFAVSPGDYIETTIADTGTGIPSEVREHIFEPFFTTKELGKGTGLGLAATYGTITEHGGTIRVYSEPDQGSTFKVYLPLGTAPPVAAAAKDFQVHIPQGRTVLLADDEELLRQLGDAMLSELGLKVLLANDGKHALETFAEHCHEIDLVMLDVVMPVISGRDAFKMMKEINPNIRVLFLSGYTRLNSVEDLMSDPSVIGFLQKPYRIDELRLAVSKAFAQEH